MARPRLYDDALRGRLIDAAASALASGGAAALALRRVAEDAGTTTNAVYSIFGGRAELVEAVLAEADASLAAHQRAALTDADPAQRLYDLGVAYRSWALAHPTLYAVMFGVVAEGSCELEGAPPQSAHPQPAPPQPAPPQGFLPLLEVVQQLADAGRLDAGTAGPSDVALCIWAGVHGMVTLEVTLLAAEPRELAERRYRLHLDSVQRAWVRSDLTR